MQEEHLAITSVPCQKWGALYDEQRALQIGTVFQDLDKPFFVTENDIVNPSKCGQEAPQEEREKLLSQIQQVSFYLDDLTLYLDMHSCDKEALKLFWEKSQERKKLKQEFAAKFYPLTRDCLADDGDDSQFIWQSGPMPWEGACV